MRMNDLDVGLGEGKLGDLANWAIDKFAKKASPTRIEPDFDLARDAAERVKPKIRMVDGKPMEVKPDGTTVPYKAPEAPKAPAPKVEPEVPAPKVEPEVPPVEKKPGIIKKTVDFAKDNPKTAAGISVVGSGAVRHALDDEGKTSGVLDAAGQNVGDLAGGTIDFLKGMKKGYSDGNKPAPTDKEAPKSDAPPSAAAPEEDPEGIPEREPTKESITTILKLSGQRPITERDNVMGIVKPKEIKTLTESADLSECGMAPMGGSQPASLNISASASTGEEVAGMLKAIMQLAGVQPVQQSMMPQQDNMPMVKALQILGGEKQPIEDGMNAPSEGHDEHDHESEYCDACDRPAEDCVCDEKTDEEYDNTPADPTDVPVFDPEKMVFRPNQAGQGDRMDGTMPKGIPSMEESGGLAESLLKAYESFKSGQ